MCLSVCLCICLFVRVSVCVFVCRRESEIRLVVNGKFR